MSPRVDPRDRRCQNATMGPSRQARRWVDPRGSIVPLLVIALAVVSVTATGRSAGDVTRLAQLSPAIFALDVLAGLSMVAAGVVAWRARRRETGMATMLAGLCWFGADWAGTTSAPGVLRAVGLVGTVMTLPIALRAVVATRPLWLPGSARAVLGAITDRPPGAHQPVARRLGAVVRPAMPRCL